MKNQSVETWQVASSSTSLFSPLHLVRFFLVILCSVLHQDKWVIALLEMRQATPEPHCVLQLGAPSSTEQGENQQGLGVMSQRGWEVTWTQAAGSSNGPTSFLILTLFKALKGRCSNKPCNSLELKYFSGPFLVGKQAPYGLLQVLR